MRVVFDSNVLARATPGKTSAAREVLLLVTQAPHVLVTAAPFLTELVRILQYPRVRALHGLDDAGIQAFLQSLQAGSAIVTPVSPPPIQTRDPDDDLVIATAVAGQAEVICTWDQHLFEPAVQAACATRGIRVLKDSDLLLELRSLVGRNPARLEDGDGASFHVLMGDVLETLARLPSPQEILALRPSPALQEHISALVDKQRNGRLSADEERDWQKYQYIEHLVRIAKAKAALQLKSSDTP
jgi:putative PIN family toxin of toxin-antitoxin system